MLSLIFYREKEIFKNYFSTLILSIFSNFLFIIVLFVIFNGADFFNNGKEIDFLLVSYLLIIMQSQIFSIIYNHHDQKEKVFEYTFLFFENKLALIFVRLLFITIINIIPVVTFYLASSFVFQDLYYIALFILSVILISLNNLSLSIVISNAHGKFISYFFQIFLIPLNWPILIFLNYSNNAILIFFSILLAVVNSLIVSFCHKVSVIN